MDSILFLGPSLFWEKRVLYLVCVSSPSTPNSSALFGKNVEEKLTSVPTALTPTCSGLWRCPLPPPTSSLACWREGALPAQSCIPPPPAPPSLIYSNLLTSAPLIWEGSRVPLPAAFWCGLGGGRACVQPGWRLILLFLWLVLCLCSLAFAEREKKCEQSRRRWENGSKPQCALPQPTTFPLVVGNPYPAK